MPFAKVNDVLYHRRQIAFFFASTLCHNLSGAYLSSRFFLSPVSLSLCILDFLHMVRQGRPSYTYADSQCLAIDRKEKKGVACSDNDRTTEDEEKSDAQTANYSV